MEDISLSAILSGSSVLLSFLGFYFVARIWVRWKITDKEVLKARIFLNKKFLARTWMYIFLAGASMTVHQSIEFLISLNNITDAHLTDMSEIFEFMTFVFIVVLAYEWHRITYLKDRSFLFIA
jgi:hypothetical protein